jgi:tRNA threonylcarbamoyl adenosine modification protein (Sua5/YciO/YrdC/YwlC family)
VDEVERAVAALERGRLIVYPTETSYGLGADATLAQAVHRLADLKDRDRDKPVSVLVASRAMLDEITSSVSPVAERLVAAFWPGPLTIALPARAGVLLRLTAGSGTIAARISSHPIAQAIVEALGRPLTATSANPGGLPPARDVAAARAYFGARIDVYADGGPSTPGPASTVVDCSTPSPRLLREGAIPLDRLEAAAGMRLRRE